jgi:GntR family transcriptional regulator
VIGLILKIDSSSSTPVYAQIVEQVRRAVASGALRSGDSLPSLRETALNLRVNPLTVDKAYKLLESEGLIHTRHGLGSYVADGASSATDDYRRKSVERAADALILDAANLGLTVEDLRAIVDERISLMHQHLQTNRRRQGDGK